MTNNPLRIIYMGTPHFAVLPLQKILEAGHTIAAVVTVPDKPAGRGRQLQASAVKQFAVENNLPLLQPEKLKDPNFLVELQKCQPDVIVVVAFRMLPKEVWQLPRLGTFNLHASLLPQYRGAAPINWAVINGEEKSGVTTFLIDDKIDTGEILLQKEIELAPDETAGTLHDKLMTVGSDLVVETLERLRTQTVEPTKQATANELKNAPKIFRENCKINWQLPGKKIEQFVRGLSPYPGAFSEITIDGHATEVKILMAEFIQTEEREHAQNTGWLQNKMLYVRTVDGVLEVKKLQLQGKRTMDTADFINGLRQSAPQITLA